MNEKNLLLHYLEEEKEKYRSALDNAENFLKSAPAGSVQIRKHGKGVQFFHRKAHEKNGTYIPVNKRSEAIALVQKRYLEKTAVAAKKQLDLINSFQKKYDPDVLKRLFYEESKVRRRLIKPIELPDDLYSIVWQKVEYERKGFHEDSPEHYTQKGERVRSKSEVMIADALFHAGIPYRYEFPLRIGNHVNHPDFTVLRIYDRKEIIWEHLGLLDDPEYRDNAFRKIRDYETNGIYLGESLIITFETHKLPLNAAIIQRVIRHYFL